MKTDKFPWKSEMPSDLTPVKLTDAAKLVLDKRYRWKDKDGNFVETYEEMFWRVAWNIAQAENEGYRLYWARQFYEIMANLDFLPNSPTLANAGRDSACYSACFVIPIEDSMKGIYKCVADNALVQKNGAE
jgi:Ribonucleotide reductase, alpha subunit